MTSRHRDLAELPIFATVDVPETTAAEYAAPTRVADQRPAPLSALGRHADAAQTAQRRPTAVRDADGGQVDWGLARSFRQQAAKLLAEQLPDRTVDPDREREIGREIIHRLLDEHVRAQVRGGAAAGLFSPSEQDRLAGAVFDSLFGLGRLQPLV